MKQDTLEGKAKTKNGVKRLCFSIICILLEVIFIITIVTRLNEYAEIDSKLLPMLPDSQECLSRIKETIPKAGNIASYIQRNSQYPIYQNTDIVYLDEAVKGLEAQLKDLEKAQKFIFMEYHAIEDAEAWHKIQDVLEERE